MNPTKPLVLALAAAGLLTGESLPEAYSEDVFVPELALLEGGICGAPAPFARTPAAIRLAQAGKTEVGPAAPAAAASMPVQAESDPPILPGLGTLSYRATTAVPQAQRYFDQGLRLAWAFNHDEARRAFRMAQRLDPECALCYWGEAWVLGPNINAPMEPAAIAPAIAAAGKAASLAARARPQEQVLIAAMQARYSADPKVERATLDAAFAQAMRDAAQRFPDDVEIAAIYADALMNTSPWDYWESGGAKLKANVAELVPTLERILAKRPDHPGAIHLYIHAVEASNGARRAERYADRLGKLMPGAGHIVHMPSHIYYRIGRYKDSLAVNQVAAKVDEAYIERFKPSGIYPLGYYPHNVHFVLVSAQMGGDAKTTIAAAAKLAGTIPDEVAREVPLLLPIKAAPYFAHAQFGTLAQVMALPEPGAGLPFLHAARRYARGIALVQHGRDLAGAREELAALEGIASDNDLKAMHDANIPGKNVLVIAAHVLRARIAQAQNDLPAAIRDLEAAVALQDTLPYMEPPYWYYPVRQTLGALLALKGEHQRARDVFRDSLARSPNNGWALYGLAQTYARQGLKREAQAVERHLARAWFGARSDLDLARL